MSRLRLRSLYNAVRAARSDHLERPFMSRIEEVTPQALIDLYSLMSDDSQWAFLKLLGGVSLAEAPFPFNSTARVFPT